MLPNRVSERPVARHTVIALKLGFIKNYKAISVFDCSCLSRQGLYTRGYQINFALGYLAGAHLRFYLMVFKSDPLDECEYTL